MLSLPDEPAAPPMAGPGVSIALVAPTEPVPEAGSVMDVGELTDGYQHRPYVRQADYQPLPYDDFEPERRVYVADNPPVPQRREWSEDRVREEVAIVENQGRQMMAWLGFDQPRPDYSAQRRERMERLDREAANRREERPKQWYRHDDRDDRRDYVQNAERAGESGGYREDRRYVSRGPDDRRPQNVDVFY